MGEHGLCDADTTLTILAQVRVSSVSQRIVRKTHHTSPKSVRTHPRRYFRIIKPRYHQTNKRLISEFVCWAQVIRLLFDLEYAEEPGTCLVTLIIHPVGRVTERRNCGLDYPPTGIVQIIFETNAVGFIRSRIPCDNHAVESGSNKLNVRHHRPWRRFSRALVGVELKFIRRCITTVIHR